MLLFFIITEVVIITTALFLLIMGTFIMYKLFFAEKTVLPTSKGIPFIRQELAKLQKQLGESAFEGQSDLLAQLEAQQDKLKQITASPKPHAIELEYQICFLINKMQKLAQEIFTENATYATVTNAPTYPIHKKTLIALQADLKTLHQIISKRYTL